MPGFRGASSYAGVPGADLENAPQGPVPFTSPIGLPITRMVTWHAGGVQPGGSSDGVPGTPVQRTSGNPDVATVPRFGPVQQPYGGSMGTGVPQFGTPRPLKETQENASRAPGSSPVGYSNDKLITYDRHGMMKVGYENSGRDSGNTDPPKDGPARPSLWLVQRTINYQQGTDTTAAADDLSRDYSRTTTEPSADPPAWITGFRQAFHSIQGKEGTQYVGEQGSGWSPIYGGVPGLYQPYGSYAGITNGPVQGIQSPIPEGLQGDGPRKVWSGPPHGLHSPTLPIYNQTLGRYLSVPQMVLPRIDRPSNSPIAGQSFSQTVQPQGQTGTAAQNTRFNSGVNFNQRVSGNGWRGRASG
jgi:hypothetical protein